MDDGTSQDMTYKLKIGDRIIQCGPNTLKPIEPVKWDSKKFLAKAKELAESGITFERERCNCCGREL